MPDQPPPSPDQEPLRYGMMIPFPDGPRPLTYGMKGAVWGGTVGDVLRANANTTQPMPTQNIVTGTFTAAQRTAIEGAVQTILANLPFAVDLSILQRRDLLKMGDKSVAFVRKAKELAQQNPAWLPATFPRQEFIDDLTRYDDLASVEMLVTTLLEKITDTRMASSSDAMVAALMLYGIAKAAGAGSNLDDLLQDMGSRFSKKKKAAATQAKA